MAAPLADDERPIPSSARMCGEFINPLHYHSNLQQFPVSSMAPMGMLMGHISVGLLDHLGGSILPQPLPLRVSDSGLLCIAAYIMACPIVTRRKLTQQVVNSSNITQHNVLVQAAFFVIPFVLSVMLPGSPGGATTGLQRRPLRHHPSQ